MSLPVLVIAWIPLLVLLYGMRFARRTPGVGLVAAYLVNLAGLHWVAGLIRLFPWFKVDLIATTYGLEQGTYALAAFVAGSLVFAPMLVAWDRRKSVSRHRPHPDLPYAYLLMGILAYILLFFFGTVPTLTAVINSGQQLYVAGICLLCWKGIREKRVSTLVGALVLAGTLPAITIVTRGFMGIGAAAATLVYAFTGSFTRPWKTALTTVFVLYFGLSFYVTYMRDRREIRASVWGGQSLSDRIDTVSRAAGNFEWFDPRDYDQLSRVDGRMNQNLFVGLAVQRLASSQEFARGSTIVEAALALIPRALWPEKTVFAGSGDLVSRYTGIHFAYGSSFGIGQVMEFYINFGTAGVVVGFILLGALLTAIDEIAARRVLAGNYHSFVVWFLAGIGLLQAGGSLVEVTSGTAASILTAILVNRLLLAHMQRKQNASPRPIMAPAVAHPQA